MAGNAIDELVSTLYEMVQDAGGIPLMSDRCVIEREKALDILDEIRANIPSDLKMAREIVEKRNEFITAGKREAEAIPILWPGRLFFSVLPKADRFFCHKYRFSVPRGFA